MRVCCSCCSHELLSFLFTSFVFVLEFPGVSAPSFFQRLLLLTLGRLEKRVSAKLLTSDSGNRIISQKQITNKFKYIYTPKNKHQRTSKKQKSKYHEIHRSFTRSLSHPLAAVVAPKVVAPCRAPRRWPAIGPWGSNAWP